MTAKGDALAALVANEPTGRCRLFHDWPVWSKPKMMNVLWDGKYMGQEKYQERSCRRCGKHEERQV